MAVARGARGGQRRNAHANVTTRRTLKSDAAETWGTMAQTAARIVSDEDVMGGEPRIEGRRITVRQIAELVVEGDEEAETVAERHDLDVADVYRALVYYQEHPEEMAAVRRWRERLESEARASGAPTVDELDDG